MTTPFSPVAGDMLRKPLMRFHKSQWGVLPAGLLAVPPDRDGYVLNTIFGMFFQMEVELDSDPHRP